MRFILTLIFICCFLNTSFAKDRHSDRYHKRVDRVCDKRQSDPEQWVRGISAFAREANGMHCGWSYRQKDKSSAKTRALIACRKNATSACRVLFVLP